MTPGSPRRAEAFPACSLPETARSDRRATAVQQDIDAEAARVNSNPTAIIGDSWTWTNLSSFSSHGGKVIFYHGVSDPWFSAKDTIDYYKRMSTANGGDAKVKDWSRLFLSPGMGHCSGGSGALDTFDFLSAAVNWVEKNSPPESVTATGRAFPGRSRPLCAYPAARAVHRQRQSGGCGEFYVPTIAGLDKPRI